MNIINLEKNIKNKLKTKNSWWYTKTFLSENKNYKIESILFNKNKKCYLKKILNDNEKMLNINNLKYKRKNKKKKKIMSKYFENTNKIIKQSKFRTEMINNINNKNYNLIRKFSLNKVNNKRPKEKKIFKKNSSMKINSIKSDTFNNKEKFIKTKNFRAFYFKKFLTKKISNTNFNDYFNNKDLDNKNSKRLKDRFLRRENNSLAIITKNYTKLKNFHYYVSNVKKSINKKKAYSNFNKEEAMKYNKLEKIVYIKKSKSAYNIFELYNLNNVFSIFENKIFIKRENSFLWNIIYLKILRFSINNKKFFKPKLTIKKNKKIETEKNFKLILNIFKIKNKFKCKKLLSKRNYHSDWINIINHLVNQKDLSNCKVRYYDIKKIKKRISENHLNNFYEKIENDLNLEHNKLYK